jgi:hypothetical protein
VFNDGSVPLVNPLPVPTPLACVISILSEAVPAWTPAGHYVNSESEEIRQLLLQVAPERSRDIDGLFAKYPLQFERVRDTTGFTMATSFGVVLYNDRAFQQIYLISFLAWRALIEQSGGILLFEIAGRAYDHGALGATPSQREAEQAVDAAGAALRALRDSESLDHATWPPDLPYPTLSTLPFKDKQHQAVYEIAVFAVAYIVLHEIRHAMFAHEGDSPDGIAEERECDTFALQLLLDGTREFAAMRGNPPQAVLSKRAMGAFLGQSRDRRNHARRALECGDGSSEGDRTVGRRSCGRILASR